MVFICRYSMSNKTYNSQEDIYHKAMGEICLEMAKNPNEAFFMNINDTERRKRIVKKAIPNGNQHLNNYGGDPILTVIGYYIHKAIAHFEIVDDKGSYIKANSVRTARNIAYDDSLIQAHKNQIRSSYMPVSLENKV